jgi:hypothetical protein
MANSVPADHDKVKNSERRTTIGITLGALCWAIEVERFLNDEDCMLGKVFLA